MKTPYKDPEPISIVQFLVNSANKYPPITRKEEIELGRRAREENDPEARDKLVQSNLRFVISIAKRYQHNGVGLEELIQEGNLGMVKAANRYDETLGFKFVSYAVWYVKKAIREAITYTGKPIRLTPQKRKDIRALDDLKKRLTQQLGREPILEELARETEIDVEATELLISTADGFSSLNLPIGNYGNEEEIIYLLKDPNTSPEVVDGERAKASIIELVTQYKWVTKNDEKPRELEILERFFGLNGNPKETLESIGKSHKLSRERIRQIKDKALRKLRATTIDPNSPNTLESLRDLAERIDDGEAALP